MARKRITPGSMDHPSALYEVHSQKVTAGLDALLYSPQPELEILAEYLSLNRVILGNGGFCLLLAKIRFLPEHGLETPMDAGSAFADLLEARLVQRAIYYMLPIRGLVLCLVAMPNFKQDSKRLMVKNQLLWDSGLAATEQFLSDTGLHALVAISPTCFGLSDVPGTFQRTLDQLEFYSFFGQYTGVCGNPTEAPKRHIRLSSEFQESCMTALNLLVAGQREEFFQFVQQSLEQIRTLIPASLQQYKTLCYQYVDRLCYDLIDHHLADAGMLERTDLFWLVHEPDSFPKLCTRVRALLEQLLIENHTGRRHGQDADTIKAYIQLHHRDMNLTVTTVAEEFGMSQPVLSAFFLKHTGVSPLEYLNKQRTATALELLRTTDETLPEVARSAGFGSVSTMHRIFKKYTGMTPSQAKRSSSF